MRLAIQPPARSQCREGLVIENSELIDLHSEQTGRDYELIVGLPESYVKEPQRRYPVLYLLDGQCDFNIGNQMSGALRYDKVIPEILVVGITYAGEKPNYTQLRRADYTPTHWQPPDENAPFGGDGPKFLRFLQENLLPTVEATYRVDASQRILAGHSAGGLFTLYALLEKAGPTPHAAQARLDERGRARVARIRETRQRLLHTIRSQSLRGCCLAHTDRVGRAARRRETRGV
jgi:enterochelin esterase-like enzyme